MSCDVGEVTERLENVQSSFSRLSVTSPLLILQPFRHSSTSQLILQPFLRLTYVTAHSPTLSLLLLHHSSFSNPSVASPISQLILQPICHFTYVTVQSPTLPLLNLLIGTSPTSPGEPPMICARAEKHSGNGIYLKPLGNGEICLCIVK